MEEQDEAYGKEEADEGYQFENDEDDNSPAQALNLEDAAAEEYYRKRREALQNSNS